MVNLRSINVYNCKKLDCSRALELLASWDWAMQLESLNIGGTNAEGNLDGLAKCTALVTLDLQYCSGLRGPCPRPAASKSPT